MQRALFLPIVFTSFCFALYLFTAPPFMLWLDSARFVSAIVTLGVPNPPEPLYILLAHPFIYLPFGSAIFKIQIFSALLAAGTLVLLYKLILLVLKSLKQPKLLNFSALFGTALLAFSYQFWSQAQNIETFILVAFISVLCLYLALVADTKKNFFVNFCLIALIMGLATGTNPVVASIIPSLLWVMWNRRKFLTAPALVVWVLIGAIAIVAIHLYIPWRAQANPFLNYWRAVDFAGTWNLSTGSGLNVYVPELGRINGFTGSPEVFFRSTFNFVKNLFLKFTPLALPFIALGMWYLWKKDRYYFIFFGLIILTNWLFSSLYFSGNQESWFLVSDVSWVVFAAFGFWALATGDTAYLVKSLKSLKIPKLLKTPKNIIKYKNYLLLVAFVPLVVWLPFLNRHDWVLTEDYIKNLYRPIGNEPAILFGSSDLFDSVSFYVHDVKGTSVYRPNVIPVTDNIFYIFKWYRDNLRTTTGVEIPDDSGLKYNSAQEYSDFVNEFFAANIDKYKIYVTTPAMRNNFLQVYEQSTTSTSRGSLKISDDFKLIPQGMIYEVARKDATVSANLANFDYQFGNSGFPKKKPFLLEQTYRNELTGLLNEYAYSLEGVGDSLLQEGKEEALKFYQKAYEFSPNNAEIISRLGNYYGSTGDHNKALEFFEKALKLEPNNIGLLFNSAVAYENTGKTDKAIKNYNKIISLARGQDQIGTLAQSRLQILRGGTPSAGLATGSGSLQDQLLNQLGGGELYESREMNLKFVVPEGFKVTKEGKALKLANGLTDKDELSFWFYGKKLAEGAAVENVGENLPFSVEGPVLSSQPIQIPGFEAVGKTYGSGAHITFLFLMKKDNWGIAVKVYPGDSNKAQEFNQVLNSVNTLN